MKKKLYIFAAFLAVFFSLNITVNAVGLYYYKMVDTYNSTGFNVETIFNNYIKDIIVKLERI